MFFRAESGLLSPIMRGSGSARVQSAIKRGPKRFPNGEF